MGIRCVLCKTLVALIIIDFCSVRFSPSGYTVWHSDVCQYTEEEKFYKVSVYKFRKSFIFAANHYMGDSGKERGTHKVIM